MEWTRVQTSLLLDRIPERDLTAILKYQLLWAHLEREPTKEMALRHLTQNQLDRALSYYDSISAMVIPDIRKLYLKRGRDKKNYYKNKAIEENPTHEQSSNPIDGTPNETLEHITGEDNKTNKNKFEKTTIEKIIQNDNGNPGFKGIPIPVIKFS